MDMDDYLANQYRQMHKSFIYLTLLLFCTSCTTQRILLMSDAAQIITPFEQKENYSATYRETISTYKKLAAASPYIQMSEYGMTDIGRPLHEIIVSTSGDFDPVSLHKQNKNILFINNGIHAGEPCGIDASMMLVRDIAAGGIKASLLENTVLVIVPVYNIGGCLNRSSTIRANQNGPAA